MSKNVLACLLTASLTIAGASYFATTANAEEPKAAAASSAAITLFNGKDLTGWAGRSDLWSVEEGMIVGKTTAEDPIKNNTFLVYEGELPGDYELVLQFKIEAGNSGVQYRSQVIDKEKFIVGGYQADIDFGNTFAGILYEERGRGILAKRGENVTIDSSGEKKTTTFADAKELGNGIHAGEWNEFRVVAKGNRVQHFINGAMTIEVTDGQEDKAAKSGVIALQLHVGPPMVVRFKNMVVHPL